MLAEPAEQGHGSAFRQGLLTNLLNPKIALLHLTLIPQFVSPGETALPTTSALAAVFLTSAVPWWRAFSFLVVPLGRLLLGPDATGPPSGSREQSSWRRSGGGSRSLTAQRSAER